jgi:hypothetical protein
MASLTITRFQENTMSRIARFAVLVTALASLFAVLSSTAGAVTWDNSGSTAFTATGGAGTLTVTASGGGSNNLSCLNSTATGSAPADITGATYLVTGTVIFGGDCKLSGVNSFVDCNYTLTGLTFSSPVTTGSADVTCRAGFTGAAPICHIAGSTPGSYTNATATTFGKLTLSSSASLTVTGETGPHSCSALLGSLTSGIGHLTEQTITVSNGTGAGVRGPILNRTP